MFISDNEHDRSFVEHLPGNAASVGAELTGAELIGALVTGEELTGAELIGALVTGAEVTGLEIFNGYICIYRKE